jgi:hypothetical protein
MATPEQIADYDRMHPRARADALTRPPFLYLDMCGYEYSLHHAGDIITCRRCGDRVVGQDRVTLHADVAYTDMSMPLGRRQSPLGLFCSERCADAAFAAWKEMRRNLSPA